MWIYTLFALLLVLISAVGAGEKVILDTDMVMLYDDGVAMIMLANHPDIELLGVTIAAAIVIDQTLIVDEETRWVDVNSDYNLDYGRSLGYKRKGPAGTRKVRILFTIDEDRFWNLMVDLLTK